MLFTIPDEGSATGVEAGGGLKGCPWGAFMSYLSKVMHCVALIGMSNA